MDGSTGPGCRGFWDSLDEQSDSIKISHNAQPVDRALTRLRGSKRPASINEQIWKGCSRLWETYLKKNRARINRETNEAEREAEIGAEREAEREAERAADRARSDETFRQMHCRTDCSKMCRPRSPGDDCMVAQNSKRACEGR
jgi:hypothetical protein